MSERELVRSIIDLSFIIKGQMHSEETLVLRSILNIVIMEAEDVLESLSRPQVVKAGRTGERRT